jgi:hypothetical protein
VSVPFFPIQNFTLVQYQGTLTQQNVSLLTTASKLVGTTTAGIVSQSGHQSAVVNTTMDWLNTYPGQAVTINLQSAGTTTPLDKILMLYIDNSRNPNNVTVGFADSQQFLEAPAFTTGYYPVFTQNLFFNVYNGTTGKAPVTAESMTAIIACNFAVPGFLSQNTLNVTFNSSSGPRVPTIGDTPIAGQYAIAGSTVQQILNPLTLPLQYVITDITLTGAGLYVDNSIANGQFLEIQLNDTALNRTLRQFNYFMAASCPLGVLQFVPIVSLSGLNYPVQSLAITAFFPGPTVVPAASTAGFITWDIGFASVSL